MSLLGLEGWGHLLSQEIRTFFFSSTRAVAGSLNAEKAFLPLACPLTLFSISKQSGTEQMAPPPFYFQLVRLDLLMKWSLYAILPMQMCSCTFFIVDSAVNCPCSEDKQKAQPELPAVRMVHLYLSLFLYGVLQNGTYFLQHWECCAGFLWS